MELRHLRYFVAVAEEENVTRAAARLNIQQPPLGQQIKALEDELGVQLFDRSKKKVRLNPAGQVFLQKARDTLASADEAVINVRRFVCGEQGNLVVGFTTSASLHAVSPLLISRFRAAYPFARLQVQEQENYELLTALEERQLDVALLRSDVIGLQHLETHVIAEEEMFAAVPAGSELSHPADSPVDIGRLLEEPFVACGTERMGIFDWLKSHLARQGLKIRIAEETRRIIASVNLVAAGLGVTIVPASMRVMHRDRVVYRRLAGNAVPPLPLYVTRLRGDHLKLADNFMATAVECAETGMATVDG